MAQPTFKETFANSMRKTASALVTADVVRMARDMDTEALAYGLSKMKAEQLGNVVRNLDDAKTLTVVRNLNSVDAESVAAQLPKDKATQICRRVAPDTLRSVLGNMESRQLVKLFIGGIKQLAAAKSTDPLGFVGAGIDVANVAGDAASVDALKTGLADHVAAPLRTALGDKAPLFLSVLTGMNRGDAQEALGGLSPSLLAQAMALASPGGGSSLSIPTNLLSGLTSDPLNAAKSIMGQIGGNLPGPVSSLLGTMFSDAKMEQVLSGAALGSLQSGLGSVGSGFGSLLSGNLSGLVGAAGGGGALASLMGGLPGGGLSSLLSGAVGGLNPSALAGPLASLGGGALGGALSGLGGGGLAQVLSGNTEFVTSALDGMADGAFKKLSDALTLVGGVPGLGDLQKIQGACENIGKTLEAKVLQESNALKRQVIQMAGITEQLAQVQGAITSIQGALDDGIGKLREVALKNMPSMEAVKGKMEADLSLVKGKDAAAAMGSINQVLEGALSKASSMMDGFSVDGLGSTITNLTGSASTAVSTVSGAASAAATQATETAAKLGLPGPSAAV